MVGFSTDRLPLRIAPADVEPRVDEEPAAEWTHFLRAKRIVLILRHERALGLVVPADALVLVHEVAAVEAETQRLIARGRPVEIRRSTTMNSRGTRNFSVSTRVPVDRAMLEFGVSYEELPLTLMKNDALF